jgi:putative ATP-dependent endonuclease of OLD family
MQMHTVTLHNFRSVRDATIRAKDYSLLVGQNNAGKTNVLTALRAFYEHEGTKFTKAQDFPKYDTDDDESWIEIDFETTEAEQASLRDEYRSDDGLLRIRRYFAGKDWVRAGQSNIYAYEGGVLSRNLFYGAKNVSQARLGEVVYIPEVAKPGDSLKVSGPSPFRDMLNFVMKRAVLGSNTFEALGGAFETFNREFGEEYSQEGFSVNRLIDEINAEIKHWRIRFGIRLNPIRPEDIVKNLIDHFFEDANLPGQEVGLDAFGQGLQRHLIYTLLMLVPRYAETRATSRKEFSPDFTLVLFEEPEAFLHPSQQERLNSRLRNLAGEDGQQIIVTTHSPQFVSRNISDLGCLARLHKGDCVTQCYQLCDSDIEQLLDDNLGLFRRFQSIAEDSGQPENLRKKISDRILGGGRNERRRLEDESIRYLLWLTPDRTALFFADHVVICEGMSERALLDYLVWERWPNRDLTHVAFIDALGKYNIHRCIALLSRLGINHSVIMDKDRDPDIHDVISSFIDEHRTALTTGVEVLDPNLEGFLGISVPRGTSSGLKPLNILSEVMSGGVPDETLDQLADIVVDLVHGEEHSGRT